MRKQHAITLCTCLCLALLTGCGLLAQQPPPTGSILVQEDFSADNGLWSTALDSDSSMVGYQAEGLRFVVNTPYQDYFSLYRTPITHAIIEVNAAKLWGPDDNLFGVVCRYQDPQNYYGFVISSDAYYGILLVEDGNFEMLTADTLIHNDRIINTGQAVNQIRVGCVQGALWMEVNGKTLAAVSNDRLTHGQIGLMAGATAETGVDILFDDFYVFQP
ncbi:MAG TPA: hypothetical protein ENN32_07020 [Chloroflexi bacterium]|nr:hypothetical protein [Chloroflexota bacterium]